MRAYSVSLSICLVFWFQPEFLIWKKAAPENKDKTKAEEKAEAEKKTKEKTKDLIRTSQAP